MPKPVYLICSQSGAQDKDSGLLSVFQIIEKIQFSKTLLPNAIPMIQMQISAAWMREPSDIGVQFQFDTTVFIPPDDTVFEAGSGEFVFDGHFQRITGRIIGFLPIQGAGVMRVRHRVRRVGASDWLVQEFAIVVEDETPAVEPSLAPSNN